jgi:hypothetical protein
MTGMSALLNKARLICASCASVAAVRLASNSVAVPIHSVRIARLIAVEGIDTSGSHVVTPRILETDW